MTTLKKLVKDINAENAPPDGWTKQDQVKDEPVAGKTYALTGGLGSRCIANGNTCLLYTSPSPRDVEESRMPSSA